MKTKASRPVKQKDQKDAKPVALTLKLDGDTYVRLSTYRARERKTAQEILTDALNDYLDRMRA